MIRLRSRPHADPQRVLGTVHEHVDVATRKAERLGDVLARPLVEEPKGDHSALDAAQLGDAGAKPQKVLTTLQELLCQRHGCVSGAVIDELVGLGAPMQATKVARCVSYPSSRRREYLVLIIRRDLVGQHGAKHILHALERLFGGQSFASRDRDERAALLPRHLAELVD